MQDIFSIVDTFDIQNITESSCEQLRKKNDTPSKKERRALEHIIREFQQEEKTHLLQAIIVYEIFFPGEAIKYARQKGVFRYGNAWPHTVYCLEKLCALTQVLHIPATEQRYLQQKLESAWLNEFYSETERKLRRNISKRHAMRIRKQINGHWVQSSFVIDMLVYISLLFRYREGASSRMLPENSANKIDIHACSNEELSEAVSYLIYLFLEEKGSQAGKMLWLDADYILSNDIERLVLLACHRNMMLEWESLVDCLGYEIETDRKVTKIYDSHGLLEKSIRIGYVKTTMQEQLFALQNLCKESVGLCELAQELVKEAGKSIFEWCCEDKLLQRYRMKFPADLLKPLWPAGTEPLTLFREEYMEIDFAAHELSFGGSNIFGQMVTDHCSAVDLILFKRLFILWHYAQRWLFQSEKDIRRIIPSMIPIMERDSLIYLLKGFVGGAEKAGEILDLLTWDGVKKLDLQYTPILKLDDRHYYIAVDILVRSNIVRNGLMVARGKGIQAANSDGKNDHLELFCEKSFAECSYPYGIKPNVSYNYKGQSGEIDLLVWSDKRLYVFECKNAILPTGSHELRATVEHIQKASKQLNLSVEALSDVNFQKTYFRGWGIKEEERSIHTCILLGNRLFTASIGMEHPVRYAYELNMVLTSGTVTSELGRWSCWINEQFADDDLARFLSDDDPLSRGFLDAMKPYTVTFRCMGRTIQLKSYVHDSLLHMKNNDARLRIIDKCENARHALLNSL